MITIEDVKKEYGFTDADLKEMNTDMIESFLQDNLRKLDYIRGHISRQKLEHENECYYCLLNYVREQKRGNN